MTLCWSLDKLGPMTRGVEDAMLVLKAISGTDAGDTASVPSKLDFDANAPVTRPAGRLRPGVDEGGASDRRGPRRAGGDAEAGHDAGAGERCRTGRTTRCNLILFAEAAAAFEELTLSRARPTS